MMRLVPNWLAVMGAMLAQFIWVGGRAGQHNTTQHSRQMAFTAAKSVCKALAAGSNGHVKAPSLLIVEHHRHATLLIDFSKMI